MEKHTTAALSDRQVVREARRVTWVGSVLNVLLAAGKIAAGIWGRSSAMLADGVHSLSDLITDVIVIIFVGISRRKADSEHRYGHGKYETFATLLIAVLLGWVGIMFLVDGGEAVIGALQGTDLPPRPTAFALWMAIGSILTKEWLYRYTRHVGERIHSALVVANAWHHRSDALSSVATLLGIAGAMYLGEHWRVLDPVAAIIVSIFIIKAAWEIGRPAMGELLEKSLPRELTDHMGEIIGGTPGVLAWHQLASRRNGNKMILDFHIKLRPEMTVREAHDVSKDVEQRLKEAFGPDMFINIHMEPYAGEPIDAHRRCPD